MSKTRYPSLSVLLVDDENPWLNTFSLTLQSAGINNVETCNDSRKVMGLLEAQSYSVLVLDITMPYIKGDELLPLVIKDYPEIPVIIITGLDQVETAVSCMKLGAYDFFTKVSEESRLVTGVKRAIDLGMLRREHSSLKEHFLKDQLNHPDAFSHIVTHNKSMRTIFQYIESIATTSEPVLITGETGSGKELFARAVHMLSGRIGEFVAVNIAGLDGEMLADTLFGHTKGAFSGADQTRKGLIAAAADGSIFLDEIGDLSPSSQVKLLRLIQEREYYALGSDISKSTNVRMIFATHRDLDSLQESGEFRQDLYYRINVIDLVAPPLRARAVDIPDLAKHLLANLAADNNQQQPSLSEDAINGLKHYHFPGNVRELENILERALALYDGNTIELEDLNLPCSTELPQAEKFNPSEISLEDYLEEIEKEALSKALEENRWNKTETAKHLGLTFRSLRYRLKKLGLDQ